MLDGSSSPSNSRKICSYDLPITLASTLRRPRCVMPNTTSVMPASAASLHSASSIGIRVSAPSRLKRFCPRYFVCRKRSNASAALSRSRIRRFSSWLATGGTPSTRSWIHSFWSGSWMCMYSTPTVREYASRSTPRMSRSGMTLRQASGAEVADRELAVEVPDGEVVVRDVELGMRARLAAPERVEVGDEVTAHAIHVDRARAPARPSRTAWRDRRRRCGRDSSAPVRTAPPGSRTRRRRSRRRRAAARGSAAGTRRSPRR